MAVKLRQEQQAHLAAPVLEPSVLVLALLVLALQALPAALVQLARRELQVQEELLARMALGERLVQLAWRELQEPGVRPERERSGRQHWR